MISKKTKALSFLLVVFTLFTCVLSTGITVSAATSEAGHVVYFDNSVTNYPVVYAYIWKNGAGSNAGWPGEKMTQLSENIWGYSINGNYDKIIFTQGDSSGQSSDLDYAGNSMVAVPNDNGRFQVTWSEYTGEETLPTTATTDTTPADSTEPSSSTQENTEPSSGDTVDESLVVYCQNDLNWSTVYCYMWNDNAGSNASWPGVKMTDAGSGLFMYEPDKSYANVIFNNGSTQTNDLVLRGNSYCYNNSTKKWEFYNTSPVKITSFDASLKSPCYTGCSIKLTVDASSEEGELTYKFTVTGKDGEVVLSEGNRNSVVWIPAVDDEYTLKVEVTDSQGNINSREMSYSIYDSSTLVKAFIKAFSNSLGTQSQIQQNTNITFTTDAIGGNTGTNLLFYKYEITAPDSTKNIAYYTTSNSYSYTPTQIGTYKIKVSVQTSDNSTVTNTYTYECVADVNEAPAIQIGDVNGDGVVDINDATAIQKHLVKLTAINTQYADVNGDGRISINDATTIQLKLAEIID